MSIEESGRIGADPPDTHRETVINRIHSKWADSQWVIFGASGHASSIADVIGRLGGNIVAVVGVPDRPWSCKILATDSEGFDLATAGDFQVAAGIGSNDARMRVLEACKIRGMQTPVIVAKSATLADDCLIGEGTVVLEHAHIGPASKVGTGVIVNTGAIVEHDCHVGNWAHLAPHSTALGGVRIGSTVEIGSGATILPKVKVGANATVGAGAAVLVDVPDGTVVVGVPARSVGKTQP